MSWTQIKKSINSNLMKPLDKLIEEKMQEIKENMVFVNGRCKLFKEDGVFEVPQGVETLLLTGIGAGGNGGNGGKSYKSGASASRAGGGGGGGAGGGWVYKYPVSVTPGEQISVQVGDGNTMFGTKLTLSKGGNGRDGSNGSSANLAASGGSGGYDGGNIRGGSGSGGAGGAGAMSNSTVPAEAGKAGVSFDNGSYAGAGGSIASSGTVGGGGGGGGAVSREIAMTFAAQARGGNGAVGAAPEEKGRNGYDGIGYGTGGGGGSGAGSGNSLTGGTGGAGAPGILLVEW